MWLVVEENMFKTINPSKDILITFDYKTNSLFLVTFIGLSIALLNVD